MIYYIIPAIVIIACLAIIASLIIKNFSRLTIINVDSIPKEKELRVRNRILLERLRRKFLALQKTASVVSKPLMADLNARIQALYQKAIELEQKSLAEQPLKKIDINQQIQETLEKVKALIGEKEFAKAEEECINIVRLDQKNVDVYELMTDIYLEQKEYKKARETCKYLCKLLQKTGGDAEKGRLANCYADLGWIYELEKRYAYSLSNYQKAVDLEPNNPRLLDLLLKMSIIVKNKNLASQVFNSLRQTDPENQKLPELEAEIAVLPAAQNETPAPVDKG